MYEALGVTNIDSICRGRPAQPMNPARENQEALRNQRLQAFHSKHAAHIEAHLAMLSTPVAWPMQTSL